MLITINCALANDGYSQSARVSLDLENATVKQVLNEIENKSEFWFLYSSKLIDVERKVDINADNSPINEILAALFNSSDVEYVTLNRQIVLSPVKYPAREAVANQQKQRVEMTEKLSRIPSVTVRVLQPITITGTVTDESGVPLPGVYVVVKGTTSGAMTDTDGNYSIPVEGPDAILVFSFVSMVNQEIRVGSQTRIDVTMETELTELSTVVVTGYSSEAKKDIIGSVAVVNTEEMLTTASGGLETQLQGRVAGVSVSTDGTPGGSAKVRVRGFGSFSGSDPLYIIDGVPGSIDRINSNDIESVQFLKDAASASVYGARAANGVVIITTRQGKAGETKVNFDAYYGSNYYSPNDFPDLLNAQEYGEMYWKAMAGAGRSPGDADWKHDQYGTGASPVIPEYILVNDYGNRIGGAALEALRTSDPALFDQYTNPDNYDFATHQIVKSSDTDWFDEVFNPAPIQNYNLSVSGGSDRGTFMVGLNYFDQESTADKYSYFTRYSVRANSMFNIRQKIRVGENLQVSYRENRSVSATSAAWTFHPLIPVYDIMGNPASSAAPNLVAVGDTGRNPVTEPWRNRFDGTSTWGIFGNVFLEADLFRGLTAKTSFGTDYFTSAAKNLSQITHEHYENATSNSLAWNWRNGNTWTWTNTLNYAQTFGNHTFKVLLGTEAVSSLSQNVGATRADFTIQDDPDFLIINAGIGTQTNSGSFSRNTLYSLFGRLDYSYADRYIINGTVRRDESSKFGINERTGYFPAAAIGWRISSESFMQNFNWLTDLKLRASWGIIGNQTGLANENQFSTFTSNLAQSYPIQGLNNSIATSYTLSRLGNPDARWEKSVTTNVGFDATLLTGRIAVNFDYYVKEIQDLLVQNQAPTTGPGATQPSVNVGNMENRGIDVNITNRGTIAGDLRYEASVNFTKYKNEVTKVLDNPEATLSGGGTRLGNVTLTKAGNPISMFYGYQIVGFFNSQAEVDAYAADSITNTWLPAAVGRWKIEDVSGPDGVPDKVINDFDRTYIGSPHPDFQVGINLGLNYKNFDFSAFLFWNQGGEIFNYSRFNTDFNTYQYERSARMLYDSWTPDHTDALLPKLDINDSYSNKYATSYFVEDATYLRLKTLQLGYTIPQSVLNRISIQRLRIYVQAQNLLTFTKFSGLDPDTGLSGGNDLGMGVVNNFTPTPKQVIFGVSLGI